MHIGPGFLSPPVWAASAAVSGCALAASVALAGRRLDERKVPLMGVMGAFVFAAQMVNFPMPVVPGTSGHLGGGFLVGILLDAPLGLVVMTSVLVVQALLFQDGGLEALGANVLAMGVIPCLLGGLVRRLWMRQRPGWVAYVSTLVGGAVAVLAGATIVIILLRWSGSIPAGVTLAQALAVMDTIHLGIGIVEGLVTAAVVRFVVSVRREAVLGPQSSAAEEATA